MSTIDWATAASGTWSVASNWSGGAVPGASDDVVINALSQYHYQSYTIDIISPVAVHSLTIASRNAYVYATSALTAGAITLSAGSLETTSSLASSVTVSGGDLALEAGASFTGSLTATGGRVTFDGASLTGTVTWLGGRLGLSGGTVFRNVTWHGLLGPANGGALTVVGGLTLTGANGSGPGQAVLGSLTLDQVKTLGNATITLAGKGTNLQVENSPTLTLGSHLVLEGAAIRISAGDTLTNDGTLVGTAPGNGVSGNSFINNGTITGDFTDKAKHFTNNGSILVDNGAVLTLSSTGVTAGAQSSIDLAAGNLVVNGYTSTFGLQYLYKADRIFTSASSGFAVNGLLYNDNSVLTIGAGSQFGTLYAGAAMGIYGGTVMDLSGTESATLTLTDLAYVENAAAASFTNATLDNTNFSGASTINAQNLTLSQGTLSGVGTLNIGFSLDLEGASINGANTNGAKTGGANSGTVAVNFTATNYPSYLTIGSGQSVAGYAFNLGVGGSLGSVNVDIAGGESIDQASFAFGSGFQNAFTDISDSQSVTLGASVITTLALGELTILGQGPHGAVINDGTMSLAGELAVGEGAGIFSAQTVFENGGTITLGAGSALYIDPDYGQLINTGIISITGGALEASATDLVNTGKLSVTNGTLVLDGPLTLPDLTKFAHPGSELLINGTLGLAGQSVSIGGALPKGLVLSGEITDGALAIGAGQTLTASGFGLSLNAVIATALDNNGTIIATVGQGETDGQYLEITSAVIGTGTIKLGAGSSDASNFVNLKLDSTVAAGQSIAFISGYDSVEFGSIAAATGFAGTLTGLDSKGTIEPAFTFDNAAITTASIADHAIDVVFSNGATAALATDTTLTGSLSFYESQGNAILQYASPAALAGTGVHQHG